MPEGTAKSAEVKSRKRAVVKPKKHIMVAGDICLDVVGVPIPPQVGGGNAENWRLTGEMRTNHLAGGAMLLADMVREAVGKAGAVAGPRAVGPRGLLGVQGKSLDTPAFLRIAARLKRNEIVHSLIQLKSFRKDPKSKEESTTLRVDQEVGYSGPDLTDTPMKFRYQRQAATDLIVLDDTGNGFRCNAGQHPWPEAVNRCSANGKNQPLVVYKLNRPLPGTQQDNPLWNKIEKDCANRRLVVISVNDLRRAGVTISQGLSWERTALDVVWHLMNNANFQPLRECPFLIIRLDLDGAILWRHGVDGDGKASESAWLVYDRGAIEGTFAMGAPGRMVGVGSAFTAAIARTVLELKDLSDDGAPETVIKGIKAGLRAARRLRVEGFGPEILAPAYPVAELFGDKKPKEIAFSHQPIPLISNSLSPDRGGWRLLDQIFRNETALLQRAVMQVATNTKPPKVTDKAIAPTPDQAAAILLGQVPLAEFGNLRTHDRHEIESYRSVHTLLRDYLRTKKTQRPLSIAVFGPPGAGKSFGVTEVAASLKGQLDCAQVRDLTFNLSLYQTPEELAGAFHLVRDIVLEGDVPLVFFDEFDTSLGQDKLGWLRHFLAPMQDGKFMDRGAPHPIGKAIFVFAGGTCGTFHEFAKHPGMSDVGFKQRKGPDFLSRLRATLDVPSLNLMTAYCPSPDPDLPGQVAAQPPGTFNPFGPIESIPREAAILLRRAAILSFNLKKKAPGIIRADKSLDADVSVLRGLLFLPAFTHGNRSFEALMDMSHLTDADSFTPSMLPPAFQLPLHADAKHFTQLVGTALPYAEKDRMHIAKEIHKRYLAQRIAKNEHDPDRESHWEWDKLPEKFKHSNAEQADDIPRKLAALGLWLRKMTPVGISLPLDSAPPLPVSKEAIEEAAHREHDRWVAMERSQGAIYGPDLGREENNRLRTHKCLVPWHDDRLPDAEKQKDIDAILDIPRYLAAGGYEVVLPCGERFDLD